MCTCRISCFELEEFETAKKAFEQGCRLCEQSGKDTTVYARYIRKCNAEIAGVCVLCFLVFSGVFDFNILVVCVLVAAIEDELPPVVFKASSSSSSSVAPPSSSSSSSSSNTSSTPTPASAVQAAAKSSIVPLAPIRYEYYQTAEKLTISVLAKGLEPKDALVEIASNQLRVVVTRQGKEEVVISKQLYGTVDVAGSTYDVRKTKIEIVLKKIEKFNWPSLEGTAEAISSAPLPAAVVVDNTGSTTSSGGENKKKIATPYASSKDWNAVGSTIEKELEAEKPEGEDALQKLFRDIYSKADEDTRRAMNKSFQTSGGTVLSTNWKEVGTKNYEEEKQAPKGMEWRSWEGEKVKQIED